MLKLKSHISKSAGIEITIFFRFRRASIIDPWSKDVVGLVCPTNSGILAVINDGVQGNISYIDSRDFYKLTYDFNSFPQYLAWG